MSSTAVQYAGALRHTGCTLSDLQHTADYLTDCAPLWDALCSPAVSAREKKAVLSRLPDFDAMGELKHFYLLLADKNRFALLPEIVRQFRKNSDTHSPYLQIPPRYRYRQSYILLYRNFHLHFDRFPSIPSITKYNKSCMTQYL